MKTLLALLILGSSQADARLDPCYRPPLPFLCWKDTLNCSVVNEVRMANYFRQLALYKECVDRVQKR